VSYGRALAVMVIATFAVGAFYGAAAPALQPLFGFIETSAAIQSAGSPFGIGILNDIRFVLFILGPMLVLLAAYLLPFVVGVRREVFFGGGRR
jgi:hypothetical protein